MMNQRLRRPSLKVTRDADQSRASGFVFEVWSPFTGRYQVADSLDLAIKRIDQLAGLICQMWLQRHPKLDTLTDAPTSAHIDIAEWAELRVNPTTYRSYDTRWHDRPTWARATGLTHAVEATCGRIGYALPR
jgi:hypothetical protein